MTTPRETAGLVRAELEARRRTARAALDEAIWALALGDAATGLEDLRLELRAGSTVPPSVERVEAAVIAGDWDAAASDAKAALGGLDRLVPGYRDYVATLLSLLAADVPAADAALGRLEAYAARHPKLPSAHPAEVSAVARGLFANDEALFGTGIDALLEWHVRRARTRSAPIFNSPRAVVSVESVVALLVAHRRGLRLPDLAAYRAVQLPMLVIQVETWEGEPLPRAMPLTVAADVVAGPWLREHGIQISEAPAGHTPPPSPPGAPRPAAPAGGASETKVREELSRRLAAHEGSAWQLATWALMLGRIQEARDLLRTEAEARREAWKPAGSTRAVLGWLRRPAVEPNHNEARAGFGLALALGDETMLRETASVLGRWSAAGGHAGELPPRAARYAHAAGYLDLISDLLFSDTTRPTPTEAGQAGGPLPSTRVACVALAGHDAGRFEHALNRLLEEHAAGIGRRPSTAAAVCESAVHLAAAARRLGLDFTVEERYRRWPVPILLRGSSQTGSAACDLLGEDLGWAGER